ncbi:cyclic GMP-AMP synthase [Xiphias gladius]|uniref:cyclic GMP-AMP synthase n=1 Tax=Xiphias gladius TaxID=8245 RepID=UPI001A9996D0|nr:cyclic GMP-AMP synthase [Xiphias gladius]
MTGRGRPLKAKSPGSKCAKSKTKSEDIKQVSLPTCPSKDFKEEKQIRTTKEQKPKQREQKKPNHTDENPSVHSKQEEKTTKHCTEEINKQQRTPTDNTKAPVRGTRAKTCAASTKSTEQSAEEITKTKPKDTTKDSIKTTKTKKDSGRSKLSEQCVEEITKAQSETAKYTTKASMKKTQAKTCASKAISPENLTEETSKMQPETPEYTTKVCAPQHRYEDKAAVDSILSTTLEKLKINKNDRANAAEVINEIIMSIIRHLENNTQCFKVVEPLRTGSYYENVKISNPDEFDVMLSIPVDRVNIKPFGDGGAFYSVSLKRGNSPLKKFQETDTSPLSASKMLEEFRKEVKKCVEVFTEWEVTKKKKGCPAVTLTTKVQSVTISLDVVLCLMVKSSWPPFAQEGLKIEGWLGTKVRQEYKRKPYYLVPKYEGRGTVEYDGVLARDVWRVSFSHVEKAILKNHGSEKTCCERVGKRCCRKDCLKLLKHLLSLLKEKDSSFDKFYSYLAKTTLLHACCSRTRDSEWRASSLSQCFQQLLEDFVGYLEEGVLPNFFIPDQNLLSCPDQKRCNSLARCIKEERDNGFPIFKHQLHSKEKVRAS